MKIAINLPEGLTEKTGYRLENLEQKIIANLVLDAFKEGSITFDDLKEMLDFFSDAELKEFLREKNMLHSGGLLNLYGACPNLDFVEDVENFKILEDRSRNPVFSKNRVSGTPKNVLSDNT